MYIRPRKTMKALAELLIEPRAELLIEPIFELQTFGIEVPRCSVESLYPCVFMCVCVCVCVWKTKACSVLLWTSTNNYDQEQKITEVEICFIWSQLYRTCLCPKVLWIGAPLSALSFYIWYKCSFLSETCRMLLRLVICTEYVFLNKFLLKFEQYINCGWWLEDCGWCVNTVPRESMKHSVIPRPPNQQNLQCFIIWRCCFNCFCKIHLNVTLPVLRPPSFSSLPLFRLKCPLFHLHFVLSVHILALDVTNLLLCGEGYQLYMLTVQYFLPSCYFLSASCSLTP